MIEHLRGLATPDPSRWKPMLGGLALAAAAAAAPVYLHASEVVGALMHGLALLAWVMGACAMVGYVRWLFRQHEPRDPPRG